MADTTPTQNQDADGEQNTSEQTSQQKERLIDESSISRRDFAKLSITTVGALTMSGSAIADHTSSKADDLYNFIRQHTASEYEIPTLVRLSDESGFDELDAVAAGQGDSELFETTTEPETAAYGQIPNVAIDNVLDISSVKSVEYSPGSNPFWKIGNYEYGVFPNGEDRVEYLSYEQMVDGIQVLADRHSERIRSYPFGNSPGHHNLLEGETDPQDLWWVEITNNISDEESFKEKEKAVFSLSIHGDEPTGREGGTQLIQRLVDGDEPEIEEILDEVVLVCVFSNPDGWVSRHPQFSEDTEYERENAGGADLNRSFPTVGWIDPEHYPGEPRGANHEDDQPGEIDDDVPDRVREHVPDALSMALKLRDYENVNAIWDLHNKGWGADEFIVALSQNSEQFDHGQIHDANEMRRKVGEYIREDFGSIEENIDVLERAARSPDADEDEDTEDLGLPTKVYDYGTSVDGLGYTTTGGFRSFVGGPEEFGNLETKGNTIEIPSANGYDGEAVDLLASTYVSAIRAVTTHAASTVEATIETDEHDTAYITTDALTRSADDLNLTPIETIQTQAVATAESDETSEATFDVSDDAGEISVTANPQPVSDDDDEAGTDEEEQFPDVVLSLVTSSGETVETFDGDIGERENSEWTVSDPDAGEWTVLVENQGDETGTVTVSVEALEAEGGELGNPDPLTGVGFEQQDYEASPFVYFEENREYSNGDNGGSMEPVTPAEVADGALLSDGEPAYENVIVIHEEEIRDEQACVPALDNYVDSGGNLVLTDDGVYLLGALQSDLTSGITSDGIETLTPEFAEFDDDSKDLDHPLMADVRPHQNEIWNIVGLGYTNQEEARVVVVDPDVFDDADGSVAGLIGEQVGAGTLGAGPTEEGSGIQIIAGVLPPATQEHLHPFGLLDYGIEVLGHTLVINSLGYDQRRVVDGEVTDEWRDARYW